MKLLAKAPSQGFEIELEDHTAHVMAAFESLFGTVDSPSILGASWLRFFATCDQQPAFFACSRIAAACHDIGKANSGFQDAVVTGNDVQVMRHEHLSGLLMQRSKIKSAITAEPGVDSDIVLCAVVGHHLKTRQKDFASQRDADHDRFTVNIGAVRSLLGDVMPGLNTACDVNAEEYWSFKGPTEQDIDQLTQATKTQLKKIKGTWRDEDTEELTHRARLAIAVRAALIVADAAASGLVRERKDLTKWLHDAFNDSRRLDAAYVENKVIARRKAKIAQTGRWKGWNDFQEAAGNLSDRALLIASCGSGKTLAAWRWIKSRLAEGRTVARIIFLYPTRATSTEGFKDYVAWAPEAALLHGTAAYELDGMFENPDERAEWDFTTEDRLFAIGYWQRSVFSATVDQFLGFMQHVYRSVCLLPMLVDSVVVIDEVHSFDKSLFSALKAFLRTFDVPVLCMTASLPDTRKDDLVRCGLDLFPKSPDQYQDLKDRADLSRYKVTRLENATEASNVAKRAVADNKRVLWVVNTVDRCQELARQLNCICYHSRFKLDDRKACHNEVVAAFKQDTRAVIAVTTQVCEMSLDLDAEVLITEEAPITSMIQRMGRCNRHAEMESNPGCVYVYEPKDRKPYTDDDWEGMEAFVSAIAGKTVSQSRLQELLEDAPETVDIDRYAAFIESGPWATARENSLRDIQDNTVQGILFRDVDDYKQRRHRREPTDGLIVPVPRWFAPKIAERPSGIPRHLTIVPDEHYVDKFGLISARE